VSLTSALQEFTLEGTQGIDLARSMAPGNLTSNYAGYVPTNSDWVYTNDQQQVELEMVFNQNHSAGSNLVETLIGENEAGTRRAWELWLVHPNAQTGGTDPAYWGMKATLGQCGPLTWAEENDGMGERYVRVRYKAQYNTTDTVGWHLAWGSDLNSSLGFVA